jgi:hypothetical protein
VSAIAPATVDSFLAKSTRLPGKCQGTMANDLCGHFGSFTHGYDSAKLAADSCRAHGILYSGACPSYSHFDFYYFVEDGIRYDHIDLHVPSLGVHYANSSRCTRWLNAAARRPNGPTVGTYAVWDKKVGKYGWSPHAGYGNTLPLVGGASTSTASSGGTKSISNTKGTQIVKYVHQNKTVRSLAPGAQLFMKDSANKLDQDIIYPGPAGEYEFKVHVYAEGGKPGEALDIGLVWENKKYPTPSQHASPHYTETSVFDARGVLHTTVAFTRDVGAGDMVYFRVANPGTQTVKITMLGSEAYAFAA